MVKIFKNIFSAFIMSLPKYLNKASTSIECYLNIFYFIADIILY